MLLISSTINPRRGYGVWWAWRLQSIQYIALLIPKDEPTLVPNLNNENGPETGCLSRPPSPLYTPAHPLGSLAWKDHISSCSSSSCECILSLQSTGGVTFSMEGREVFITLDETCGASQDPKGSLLLLSSCPFTALSVFMYHKCLPPSFRPGCRYTHTYKIIVCFILPTFL